MVVFTCKQGYIDGYVYVESWVDVLRLILLIGINSYSASHDN